MNQSDVLIALFGGQRIGSFRPVAPPRPRRIKPPAMMFIYRCGEHLVEARTKSEARAVLKKKLGLRGRLFDWCKLERVAAHRAVA